MIQMFGIWIWILYGKKKIQSNNLDRPIKIVQMLT